MELPPLPDDTFPFLSSGFTYSAAAMALEHSSFSKIRYSIRVMSSYAIIKTGGKQYKVTVGTKLDVDKLNVVAGDTISFDQVLFAANGNELKIGDPILKGASVSAKVLEQHRAKKVIAFKYKRRKGFHKKIGHRKQLTKVEISAINA
jgi:large subunit ribosomal protein L21